MSEIRKSIAKLFDVFSSSPSKKRIDLYAERLEGLNVPPEYVERAVDKVIDNKKSLPSIAEVREWARMLHIMDNPAPEPEPEDLEQRRAEALDDCQGLQASDRIMNEFLEDAEHCGIVGEPDTAATVYLAIHTRLFPSPKKPVNVCIKGPSAAGKSNVASKVLKFHPDDAYLDMAGMSSKYLAYCEENFSHRFLFVWEAAGLGEDAEAMLRVLLSEGSVIWRTVIDQQGVTLRKPGPTGLLLTTTEIVVHPENETRILSLDVDDTPEQTRRVFRAIAKQEAPDTNSLIRWHGLARWLALGNRNVYVPFADQLAERIPTLAVRMRRDFSSLLGLVSAHALLHRASREEDEQGRILATLDDYAVVRELLVKPLAAQVEATVKQSIRDTVTAVARLLENKSDRAPSLDKKDSPIWVAPIEVARELQLDKATAGRRIRAAVEEGFLADISRTPNRPKIVLAAPMRADRELLPTAEDLLAGDGAAAEWNTAAARSFLETLEDAEGTH